MAQLDDRDAELVAVTAAVVTALVVAVQRVDHPEIAAQVTRLLNAVTNYSSTLAERPTAKPPCEHSSQDEALRRAVARLG
jgi:hypothetical protein